MPPSLSVIIPTYNGEEFIAAALQSVRDQYSEAIELVVVDDGSTDRTVEIVSNFAKTLPIRLITPGRLGSWVAATNLGLREASGEWACFLHQDDLWLPGRMARLRGELTKAEGAMVFHSSVFIGPGEQWLGPWRCPLAEGVIPSNRFLEHLLVQDFIAIPAPVFRRRAAVDSGGLDESLWFTADWDLWLRLGAMGPVRFVSQPLTAFRVHPASQTVARKLQPGEWTHQHEVVFNRHFAQWPAAEEVKRRVKRAATASIAVNSALAAAHRGEPAHLKTVLFQLITLGPSGWRRYLRDSRILERVGSRLRVGLSAKLARARTA